MLGFLKRNCAGILDSKALKLLYLSLVRLHLSYCSQVWAPQSVVKDIFLIESVQRWATHFICKNNELIFYLSPVAVVLVFILKLWEPELPVLTIHILAE